MQTPTQPYPAIDLSTHLYYQVVHTLTGLLPPPPDDTPETLLTRNHAAVAKVAALLPVNANEADLAAQCIAARAQAEELLRLLRRHAGDIGLVIKLNAQYGSMVRTSLSVHGRLIRVQAMRQKREAIDGAADQDAWVRHIAERSMLGVVDSDAGPHEATSPDAARATSPDAVRAEFADAATATDPDQTTEEYVSQNEAESQDTGFETWLSAQFPGRAAGRPPETWLLDAVLEAVAPPRSASPELPADENPGTVDYDGPIDAETAAV